MTSLRKCMPTEYILEKQVGLVLPSFRKIAPGVAELLRSENLDCFRENTASLENRAVFEIPEMLVRILQARTNAGEGDPRAAGPSRPSLIGF